MPDEQNPQENPPETPPVDDAAELRARLADAEKKLKDAESKAKAHEREKLSAEEKRAAELEELRAERDALKSAEERRVKGDRKAKFADEVAKLAPGVPAKRLKALLRDLEEDDGFDIAPESVSPSAVKKALERLKENDPDSFKQAQAGSAPPVPGAGGIQSTGPVDYKQRGAQAAGRK